MHRPLYCWLLRDWRTPAQHHLQAWSTVVTSVPPSTTTIHTSLLSKELWEIGNARNASDGQFAINRCVCITRVEHQRSTDVKSGSVCPIPRFRSPRRRSVPHISSCVSLALVAEVLIHWYLKVSTTEDRLNWSIYRHIIIDIYTVADFWPFILFTTKLVALFCSLFWFLLVLEVCKSLSRDSSGARAATKISTTT